MGDVRTRAGLDELLRDAAYRPGPTFTLRWCTHDRCEAEPTQVFGQEGLGAHAQARHPESQAVRYWWVERRPGKKERSASGWFLRRVRH